MNQQQLSSETRDTGLTTADLADLGKPASSKKAPNRASDDSAAPSADRDRLYAQQQVPYLREPYGRDLEQPSTDVLDGSTTKTALAEEEKGSDATPLFSSEESDDFHARWDSVQVSFVDEPRQAVQQADTLVASAMKRLAEIFAEERAKLDGQWDRGDDVSTEDLRLALRRYRSFFGRLLSI
ncbi:MAG TPA: hypothetical protein VK764_05785 [Terracidiphilus sp.]|jgi:hypothetical protein|nr:hypothetical protein [Terracidiphilus sp.]